jgi:hypothetical protein
MKKLFAFATLLLAFTVTANAQNKNTTAPTNAQENVSSEAAAKSDISSLIEKITINGDLKKDLYTLMVMKHDQLADPKLTQKDKEAIYKTYERKVMAGLNPEQRKQLQENPELLKKISH